jgi:hypothetical protein
MEACLEDADDDGRAATQRPHAAGYINPRGISVAFRRPRRSGGSDGWRGRRRCIHWRRSGGGLLAAASASAIGARLLLLRPEPPSRRYAACPLTHTHTPACAPALSMHSRSRCSSPPMQQQLPPRPGGHAIQRRELPPGTTPARMRTAATTRCPVRRARDRRSHSAAAGPAHCRARDWTPAPGHRADATHCRS